MQNDRFVRIKTYGRQHNSGLTGIQAEHHTGIYDYYPLAESIRLLRLYRRLGEGKLFRHK